MFFEETNDILKIAERNQCAIFVLPKSLEFKIENAICLEPEGRASITIDQVHEVVNGLTTKQDFDRFIVIRPAEALTDAAANAILKTLEEPGEKIHFLLVTETPSALLPTIRSRAETYIWRGAIPKIHEIDVDDKIKMTAKRLLVAKPSELSDLAEEIAKKKDAPREYALFILAVTVEMAYKSYLITKKKAFLTKIPKLIKAHAAISAGGHIKLHLVADLI